MAIPTLTDIGNRIVQGVGTLTGQIRNPFTEQIEELESRLQATNNEDEIVKLNDQLRTLRAASDEWSGYDVAKQDPTAAPEWMQSVHNAARVGGDNLDLVDVGTAFIPVGVATKGAALVGRGLGKAGRGLGALATKYVDSAAARAGEKAAEQAVKNSPVGPKVQRTLRTMRKTGVIDPSLNVDKFNTRAFNEATRRIRDADKAVDEARRTKSGLEMRRMDAHDRYNRAAPSAYDKIRNEIRSLTRQITKAEIDYNKAVAARNALSTEETIVKNGEKYINTLNARHAAREAARRETDQIAKGAYTRASKKAASEAANNSIARGLTAAGEGATRFGTDFERGAEWLASHPVIGGATEQGLIEGAHGAASYNPEYGESMGLNALEQGGLAGLMQGGISALGGRRLRAIGALPENVKIQEGLSELGSRGIEVPNYDPLRRAGMTSIDPGDANILIARETDRINNAIPSSTKINSSGVRKDITDVEKKMRSGDIKEPFKPAGNSPWRSDIGGYMHRVWQPYSPYEELIPLRDLVNTIPYGHPRPHVFVMQRGVGGPRVFTDQESISAMANADNLLRRRLLERKGLGEAADILEQSPKNITELQGLSGLHYAPLPKGAISNRMADIYSAQTEPLTSFGTAGYRAAYNALLDALREGAEGGLDGLYGLGYVDE